MQDLRREDEQIVIATDMFVKDGEIDLEFQNVGKQMLIT